MSQEKPPPAKQRRWGLRTVGFLALAAASIFAAQLLDAYKNNHFVVLTFAGLVVGLVGATICSVRGIRAWEGLPKP